MPSLVHVLIVVVLLTAAFAVFYAHRRFRQTRPYQWRRRVRARVADLVQQAAALRQSPTGRSADRWRAELFDQHLRTLPLTALLPYPGIGPGAVERLSAAGLRSVADLTRFDVQRVPGFGPAKSADVRAAVRQLVREAEGRFNAGACPKGQEFRRRVAAQAAAEQAEAEGRRLLVEAVNAALARLAPLERLADRVTFLTHLLGRPTPDLTDEVMARPLPTVGAARTDSRSHPSEVRDSLTAVLQDDEEVCPPMPTDPVLVDVTVRCPGCGAKLRARSSRPRVRFRVGCPRCGSQAVVELPESARQPPTVTPIAPPLPTPAAATSPAVARPTPPAIVARPAAPSPLPVSPPADLFQAALAAHLKPAGPPSIESPHLHRLRVFARFGFVVAKADGRVAKAERAAIRTFLADLFGHDPVLVRHLDPVIEQAEAAIPPEEVAVREVLAVATNPEDRRAVYAAAERIAGASGEKNQKEEELLGRLRAAFGLRREEPRPPSVPPPAVPPPPASPPAASAPDPRTVLDIDPGVELSADLIRRRYTLLAERADPAKAAAMGPEFAALAERKRADLRRAAEGLIARFGVPLDPPAAPPPPADIRHNPDLDDIFGG